MTTAEVISLARQRMDDGVDGCAIPLADRFLNPLAATENGIEWHPLLPFIPHNARILFLGSFPPPTHRWAMSFFYPNYINDHWRIQGVVFRDDASAFVDNEQKTFCLPAIVDHLMRFGIAYYDAAIGVRRLAGNASDKFLEVVEPTDIMQLASQMPQLRAIVTTGEKATDTVLQILGEEHTCAVNNHIALSSASIELYRLPSSSRAYPMSLQRKAEAYGNMFKRYLY